MFLNAFPGRPGAVPGKPSGSPKRPYFDFVVGQRKKYIPNSGPPLAPITIMPVHDKDGIILDLVQLDNLPRYLVGYEDKPHLRVAVKLQNILSWVSPLTLENWEYEQLKLRQKQIEDKVLPRIKAREERKKQKAKLAVKSRAKGGHFGTRKRKRRTAPIEPDLGENIAPGMGMMPTASVSGPARRNQPVEEEPSFTSPKIKQSQRPSLAGSHKPQGLADLLDIDSDEDEDDNDLALEAQLNAGFAASSNDLYSGTASPEPPHKKQFRAPTSRLREQGLSTSSASTSDTDTKRRRSERNASVAVTSSREALNIYEDLERKSKSNQNTPQKPKSYFQEKYSSTFQQKHSASGSSKVFKSPFSNEKASSSRPQKDPSPEPAPGDEEMPPTEDDDQEYEVECILDDETRKLADGSRKKFYLIKWVGGWDKTWEPSENVGTDAVVDYKDRKKAGEVGVADTKKGKGKATSKAVADDNDVEMTGAWNDIESDQDELFVGGGKGLEAGMGLEIQGQPRGEVVDDDSDDSNPF
jgi:hypothetical protein